MAAGTDIIQAFKDVCKEKVQAWTSKTRLYLTDPRTVSILVAPLHGSIVREYEAYLQRQKDVSEKSDILQPADLWALLRGWSDEAQA